MCLVVGVLGSAGACEPVADEPGAAARSAVFAQGIPAGTTPDAGQSCAQRQFPPERTASATGNCPVDFCGVNGVWLGRGVPFRTLNLDGTMNEQGLAIKSFVLANGERVTPDVVGDTLIGRGATGDHTGYDLEYAELTLEHNLIAPNEPHPVFTVTFKILEVKYLDFGATCVSPYVCDHRKFPYYRFSATTGDGCNVQICQPGLNAPDSSRPELAGDAIMFEGDLYDENTFDVTVLPRRNNPRGTFNLACLGSTISKLHFLRHTSASQSPGVRPIYANERKALLRMFTADYCGMAERPMNPGDPISGSALFTRNGTPIRIEFPGGPYKPTEASGFLRSDSESVTVDGRWNDDGATCIGVPRLEAVGDRMVRPTIDRTCDRRIPPHEHQGCAPESTTGSVISYNPLPDAGVPSSSDAGVPPRDAYPPPSDASPPPSDAYSPPSDAYPPLQH
jgi:hypothetical protein